MKSNCLFILIVVMFSCNLRVAGQSINVDLTWHDSVVADTLTWNPDAIYIVWIDMKLTFGLPYEKDRSGVANILFRNSNTDQIHLLDTVRNNKRYCTVFSAGKYDAILLYNNGKYIVSNNIVLDKNIDTEIDMTKLDIHSSDSESQQWLTMRTFNKKIDYKRGINGEKERIIKKNYTTTLSGSIIRGYVFGETGGHLKGLAFPLGFVHVNDGSNQLVAMTSDGYFEIDIEGTNQPLKFRSPAHDDVVINLPVNSGIFIVLKECQEAKLGTRLN